MKRPVILTLLALYLGYLASKSLNGWPTGDLRLLSGADLLVEMLNACLIVATAGAAVGIWRMRTWAYKAFAGFAVLALVDLVVEQARSGHLGHLHLPIVVISVGAFLGVLLYSVHGIIRQAALSEQQPSG